MYERTRPSHTYTYEYTHTHHPLTRTHTYDHTHWHKHIRMHACTHMYQLQPACRFSSTQVCGSRRHGCGAHYSQSHRSTTGEDNTTKDKVPVCVRACVCVRVCLCVFACVRANPCSLHKLAAKPQHGAHKMLTLY